MGHLSAVVLVQHLHPGAGPGPAPAHQALASVAVYLLVTVAGLLAAPLLTGVPGRQRWRSWTLSLVAVAAASMTVVAVRAHAVWPELGTGWHRAALVAHVAAAATWIGGVLHLALFVAPDRARGSLGVGIRRFTRYAVGSGATLAGTGVGLYAVHHLALSDLVTTAFGRLVTGKALLLVVAALLGVGHRRASSGTALRRRPSVLRIEAASLGVALGLGSSLLAVAEPLPVVQLLGSGVATVATDNEPTSLFLVAKSSDTASLQLLSDESVAIRDRFGRRSVQLAPGQVMSVRLSAGRASLDITNGSRAVRASLPAATATLVRDSDVAPSDPGEWTAYQLGHVLAGGAHAAGDGARSCSGPTVRQQGRDLGRLLQAAGVNDVGVVGDRTQRSRDLVAGVDDAGVRTGTSVGERVVLVTTGLPRVAGVLHRLTIHAGGPSALYLAPWLLDSNVLSASSAMRLPPITVASATDPMSPLADRFRAALSTFAPGVAPTVAALRGYLAGSTTSASTSMRLFAATPVGFLPGVVDEGHQHDARGWLANGTLVPTSTTISTRSTATCDAVPA